jgi:hypothetical protein
MDDPLPRPDRLEIVDPPLDVGRDHWPLDARLAIAIAKARNLKTPTAQDLKLTYEMALLALFRLLFVAYAEDKDLLPYRTNERYRDRSLKKKAREMAALRRQGTPTFDDSTTHWDEAVRLFRVVNTGKPKEWGVPASECKVAKGVISHSSGKRATFGKMAAAASRLEIPKEPKLKDKKDWKMIGTSPARFDIPDSCFRIWTAMRISGSI